MKIIKKIVKLIIIIIIEREKSLVKGDKQNNPLISISGAPGIGKSTFLTHFPESKEYQDYCRKKGVKTTTTTTITTTTTKIIIKKVIIIITITINNNKI